MTVSERPAILAEQHPSVSELPNARLSGDFYTAKIPFIRERSRAGQLLLQHTETCIHGPYRKLGR
jgi:hypothetical protein